MIIHDCLNRFIKNLTVILISSLYLTKSNISTFAKRCVIRPNLYEKWALIRKSKYQFIHDIRLATWWCMVLFNFPTCKIKEFHPVHGRLIVTLVNRLSVWLYANLWQCFLPLSVCLWSLSNPSQTVGGTHGVTSRIAPKFLHARTWAAGPRGARQTPEPLRRTLVAHYTSVLLDSKHVPNVYVDDDVRHACIYREI